MTILKIILIICGLITTIIFLFSTNLAISEWRKTGKINFMFFIVGLFFIPIIFYKGICDYLLKIKKGGGFRKYYKDKIDKRKEMWRQIKEQEELIKRQKAERERIIKAYENGEILRSELPRTLDGINQFEFNYEFKHTSWHNFFYIENTYNEVLNDFFKRHGHISMHNMTIWYIPKLVEELTDKEIVKYKNPESGFRMADIANVTTACLLEDLSYPEDAEKLQHGIIMFEDTRTNSYDIKFVKGNYYPLEEGDDSHIFAQIEAVVKAKCNIRIGFGDSEIHYNLSIDDEEEFNKDYAEDNFGENLYDNNIAILIDEVRERVERLHQYGISENILMKMIQVKPKLSRLVITKDFRIILPDYDNMEIKMEPLNKAVFLLFLRHNKGIVFKHLPDYKKELLQIYSKLKPNGLNEKTKKSIDDVCNPCLNSINEKCARIRGAFISQFDESLAKNYFIRGEWRLPKKIALPRDLVIWEGKL